MSDNTEQLQKLLSLQNEMFQHQQASFKQIIGLQKELVDSQERERAQRRHLFRVSCVIFVAYLLFSFAPLWLMK